MRNSHPTLVLGVLLAACGDEPPPPPLPALSVTTPAPPPPAGRAFAAAPRRTQALAAAAARLVPAEAVAVLHLRKPDDLIAAVRALADALSPGTRGLVDIAPLLQPTGLREKDLDTGAAATVAWTIRDEGVVTTYVLPAQQPEEAAEIAALEAVAAGRYVALATAGKPVAGTGAKLAAAMPDGDLVLRVDVPRVLARYGARIEAMLDPDALQIPGMTLPPETRAVLRAVLGTALGLLRDAQRIDVALSLAGGILDIDVLATMASPVDGGQEPDFDLLKRIALPGATMFFYSNLDLTPLVRLNRELARKAGATAPGARPASDILWGAIGREIAAAARTDAGALQALLVTRSVDPKAFRAAIRDYARELRAVAPVRDLVDQTVAGIVFQGWQVEAGAIAPPALAPAFGAEHLRLAAGTHEDHAILAIGDVGAHVPNLVAALAAGTRYESPILSEIHDLHAPPRLFFAQDLASSLRVTAAAQGIELPAAAPAVMWFSYGAAGATREGQVHADLGGMAKAIAELRKAMAELRKATGR